MGFELIGEEIGMDGIGIVVIGYTFAGCFGYVL